MSINLLLTINYLLHNRAFVVVLTLLLPLFIRAQEKDVTFRVGNTPFAMVAVQGGSFEMGANLDIDAEAEDDELPARIVKLNTYLIGKHEVTQNLWTAVMGNNPSFFKDGKHPVECVSWYDCMEFISRLNAMTGQHFRLPTEAEWEYAAKGTQSEDYLRYSGSDNIDDVAWWAGNAGSGVGGAHHDYGTHPVGSKYGNSLGIYDMTGNVDEWCSDVYEAKTETEYVVRGGGWNYAAKWCRVTSRDSNFPNYSNNNLGFRLAHDAENLNHEVSGALRVDEEQTVEPTQQQKDLPKDKEKLNAADDDFDEDVRIMPVELHQPDVNIQRDEMVDIQSSDSNFEAEDTHFVARKLHSRVVEVKGVKFTMKAVEGGVFRQGAAYSQDTSVEKDEQPAHDVFVKSFLIGETEVTQELWTAVMGSNPSSFVGAKHPVERVSWSACQVFIQKINTLTGLKFRLPTEAEWEYAARGGNTSRHTKYAGANDLAAIAWWQQNSGNNTHQVAQKQPNELGLYDMSGNVWEWCSDRYAENYYSTIVRETTGVVYNPQGPKTGNNRVCRGGGWFFGANFCRNTFRFNFNPNDSSYYIGMRLALDTE